MYRKMTDSEDNNFKTLNVCTETGLLKYLDGMYANCTMCENNADLLMGCHQCGDDGILIRCAPTNFLGIGEV